MSKLTHFNAAGEAHVAGLAGSPTDFPIVNAAQADFGNPDGAGIDAFVTKFGVGGTTLVYSTFIGGNGFNNAASR